MPGGTNVQTIDWDQVLETELPGLRGMVGARVDGSDRVDDVLQEVALAVQSQPQNRPTEVTKILPWLRAIAFRKSQDMWRKFYRERGVHEAAETISEPEPELSPAEWVMQVERAESVRETLGGLADEDRQILRMKYEDGLRYAEIAAALGLSVKSVEYRLSAARGKFQQAFQQT